MGMDVTAHLVESEIIADLHQAYGRDDDYDIITEIRQCFYTERDIIWAYTGDIEDAIEVAINNEFNGKTLRFLKSLLIKIKDAATSDSVLINLSY